MSKKTVCDVCTEIIDTNEVYISIDTITIHNADYSDFYKQSEIYDVDICDECTKTYNFKQILGML